jgi:hypothetical protein
MIVSFLIAITFPQNLQASSFEDSLKTAGIIMGITFGVALVVVLAAVLLGVFKGDDYGYLSKAPIEEPLGFTFCDIRFSLWEDLTLLEPLNVQEPAEYRGDYLLIGGSYFDERGKATPFLMEDITLFPGLDTAFQPPRAIAGRAHSPSLHGHSENPGLVN